ncbi:MAG: TIR domain-containing protein [Desulfococcaceae bacterium]
MKKIFISYARADWKIAKKIYDDLKNQGLVPWMDKEDILIGQNWKVSIRQAIKESAYFLALLSSNSLTKRGYVQKELKMAMDILDEMPEPDIFILPLLLDECRPADEKLQNLHWGELWLSYETCMQQVLRVIKPEKTGNAVVQKEDSPSPKKSINASKSQNPASEPVRLRSEPITVSEKKFKKVFGLSENRSPLQYIQNEYMDNGDGTVTDAATGLMWQKSGSADGIIYEKVEEYIRKLNQEKFAGYNDWHLPTIPELISLLEPDEKNGDLYIDPVFDKTQIWCWSSDKERCGCGWHADFNYGNVNEALFPNVDYYVRGVRSMQ